MNWKRFWSFEYCFIRNIRSDSSTLWTGSKTPAKLFWEIFHKAHGKKIASIAFLSLFSVLHIFTPKSCLQTLNGKVHCVGRRLHSLLNVSRRLSPEQAQFVLRHPFPKQRQKLIQQLAEDDEKSPLSRRRFLLCAEIQWSCILECPIFAPPGVGERGKRKSSGSTGSCDAPGTGDGLSSVVREEPCGASLLFSCRVSGE